MLASLLRVCYCYSCRYGSESMRIPNIRISGRAGGSAGLEVNVEWSKVRGLASWGCVVTAWWVGGRVRALPGSKVLYVAEWSWIPDPIKHLSLRDYIHIIQGTHIVQESIHCVNSPDPSEEPCCVTIDAKRRTLTIIMDVEVVNEEIEPLVFSEWCCTGINHSACVSI